MPDLTDLLNKVHNLDCFDLLRCIPDGTIQTVVTSPPYYSLRDYGVDGQIGLEETPAEYVAKLVAVFREVKRVLRDDGTVWLNLGDSYSGGGFNPQPHSKYAIGLKTLERMDTFIEGLPSKNLIGIPWRVAFALQDDGWILRSDIIWSKPNPMPESVTDRPTKAHEYVFLLSKKPHYYYDADAIREKQASLDPSHPSYRKHIADGGNYSQTGQRHAMKQDQYGVNPSMKKRLLDPRGANKRSVWTVSTEPTPFAHFATFPTKLITPMILAGAPVGGIVLDPFAGSGTTLLVAKNLGRKYIGSELNPGYCMIARDRLRMPFEPREHVKESAPLSDLPLFAAIGD